MAQAALRGAPLAAPVPTGQVTELAKKLFDGTAAAPRLRPSSVEEVQHAFEQRVPAKAREETARVVANVLELFRLELGAAFHTSGTLGPEAAAILPVTHSTNL